MKREEKLKMHPGEEERNTKETCRQLSASIQIYPPLPHSKKLSVSDQEIILSTSKYQLLN